MARPLRASTSDKSPAHFYYDVCSPDREGDGVGFAALQFAWIRARKSDGQQDERPERKQAEGLTQRCQPSRRSVGQERTDIGGQGVIKINRPGRFQIQNQYEQWTTDQSGQERVRG